MGAGGDRVLIGPGTYSRSGGCTYSDNNSINTIVVRGAGTPRPTLTMTGPFTSQGSVLTLTAPPRRTRR